MTAEPFGAGLGGQHAFCHFKKFLAGIVEIVGVLVVAEQHRVDVADLVGRERGTG